GHQEPQQPSGAMDWFLHGLEAYGRGDLEKAAHACQQAVGDQRGHFWAGYVLALCDLRAGRWSQARTGFNACLHHRPDFTWAQLLGGFASSELARKHDDANVRKEARADYDAVLKHRENVLLCHLALVNRAVLSLHEKRHQEAIRDLESAISLHPEGQAA